MYAMLELVQEVREDQRIDAMQKEEMVQEEPPNLPFSPVSPVEVEVEVEVVM